MQESVASPCIGLCRLDPATGFCEGCARTGDEIGRWRAASEAERQAILERLPGRWTAVGRRPPPRLPRALR